MKSNFSATITAKVEDWCEPSILSFEVEDASAAWDRNMDEIEDLVMDLPDQLHDALYSEIEEPGTYMVTGNVWVTDCEDDGMDCEFSEIEIKKLKDDPIVRGRRLKRLRVTQGMTA